MGANRHINIEIITIDFVCLFFENYVLVQFIWIFYINAIAIISSKMRQNINKPKNNARKKSKLMNTIIKIRHF